MTHTPIPKQANFLQVGRTIECSNCHPEKMYAICQVIEKELGVKCKCVCHDKGELPWRKNLKELVEKYPTQLENALDSAWLQGFEDKGELPENWEKEIQTGYEKLIAIIHEAHDNGLISGRLYKKFGDNFNEIVRSHLNSRELPPAIEVLQVIEMVEKNQENGRNQVLSHIANILSAKSPGRKWDAEERIKMIENYLKNSSQDNATKST